jgi:mono/diheme cytochrome c family protein
MSNKKILVMLAALMVITILFATISCTSTPQPPVKETVLVTVVPPQPTAAPAPTAAPKAPVAVLDVVGVPHNATLPNAITTTLQYVTSTVVGPVKANYANATSGLSNVPINIPVRVAVRAQDPKNAGKPTWTLIKPADSKAAIKDPAAMATEFTPDVVGAYMVGVSLKNDAGLASESEYANFNAGTYIGLTAGNCVQCHKSKVDEWAKTGHSDIFSDNVDNKRTPTADTHYTESCAGCHTTGFYVPAPKNGGFTDAEAKTGWSVPSWDKINAAGKKTGPSNFDTAPAEIKNMANIQCEQCHGPAEQHVKTGANVMAVSFNNDSCNECHAGGGHHVKGIEITFSPHSDEDSPAWNTPTGPAEGAAGCTRCHTAKGYVSFLANPKNPAAWDSEKQTLGCAGCHDPHSDANPYQLRVYGKPVEVPFTPVKDVGLSATCETCHNIRRNSDDQAKNITDGKSVSYPHYSSAAEMLSDLGGVTYGQNVPNSPHGTLVGAAPIPNPDFAKDPTLNQFMFSKAGDTKGNVPGPCVTCHMTAGPSDAKDPNLYAVGEHSFNTINPKNGADFGGACKSCHGAVTDFNMKAKADYDGNGKTEGDQDEVKGLLNTVWKTLEAKGWKKNYVGGSYADIPANADAKQKSAWFNLRYVYGVMWSMGADGKPLDGNQGAASAVHNFKRSVALLQLSLKDLGALPTGATEMK